jgi:hypothetical protein
MYDTILVKSRIMALALKKAICLACLNGSTGWIKAAPEPMEVQALD